MPDVSRLPQWCASRDWVNWAQMSQPKCQEQMSCAPHDVVPFASPVAENARLRAELIAAATRVIDRGTYILGPEVAAFEREMAGQVGTAGVVGVASGTDALVLAMQALGVGHGDEVVMPSHTAGATAAAVCLLGAVPVLVDIDRTTYSISPDGVSFALSSRTKAVVAVHLYGHPADVAGLLRVTKAAAVPLIEDCAQAQGASIDGQPIGSFGDAGCFSFYPTKNLGALGDGGAIAASDPGLLPRIRSLRSYGWRTAQFAELPGGRCSRLDELQAAMLRVKLSGLDAVIARRREIARRYIAGLADMPLALPAEQPGSVHGYHLFVARTPRRDALAAHLEARRIMTGRHYAWAVHQQPVFQSVARVPRPLVETEAAVAEIISLPMFAELTDGQVDRVIDAIRDFFA